MGERKYTAWSQDEEHVSDKKTLVQKNAIA
jgi:hypothetical protein